MPDVHRIHNSFSKASSVSNIPDFSALRVIVAIESPLVRLDALDTLRDLGIIQLRAASTAMQAYSAVNSESCDAFVLGLDVTGPQCQQLVDALERRRIPILIVSSGVSLVETLPKLTRAESLSVPFDRQSLADALNRVLRSDFKQPDAT